MKKYKLFPLLFASLVIASCASNTNNVFDEILPSELVQQNADALVFFGEDNCSSCMLLNARIKEVLESQEQEVYYIELSSLSQAEENYLSQYDIEYTPYFVELRNGEIINEFDNSAYANGEQTLANIEKFLFVHSKNRESSDGFIEIDFSLSIEEIENLYVNSYYIEEPKSEKQPSKDIYQYHSDDCYEELVHVSDIDPMYLNKHKDELEITDDGWVTTKTCFE